MVLLGVAAYFVGKLLTKHPYEQKVYAYSFVITNYGYLGYTLIEAVYGESMLADFMLFVIPFPIYIYTFGYSMLTGGKNPFKKLINPIMIAILIGIVVGLTQLPIPNMVYTVSSMASPCIGPLSMLLTGITLSRFSIKDMLVDKVTYIFCALRLLVIPAVVYLICRVAHLDAVLPLAILLTCMPCGLNTVVFPQLVGEDCRPGARLALITHAFSLITIPFWLSLI
jgi:predicted permease